MLTNLGSKILLSKILFIGDILFKGWKGIGSCYLVFGCANCGQSESRFLKNYTGNNIKQDFVQYAIEMFQWEKFVLTDL